VKRHPHSLVIEFMGVSGSGKSRLALELGERLAARGCCVRYARVESHDPTVEGKPSQRRLKAWWALRDAVLGPRVFVRAALSLHRARGGERERYLKVLMSWWYNRATARALHGQPGVHLVDDGIFQTLLSVMLNSKHMDVALFIGEQRRQLPLPDILVHVRASASDVTRRLEARPALQQWLRRLGLQSTEHYLARYGASEDALEAVRMSSETAGTWPVVLPVTSVCGLALRHAEDLELSLVEAGHIR